jgi:hypothetical protein
VTADQPVGDARRDLAHHQRVLAVAAPALQQVQIALDQLIDHARDVRRVVLQIAVQGRDQRPRAASKPACIAAVWPKLRRKRITRTCGP